MRYKAAIITLETVNKLMKQILKILSSLLYKIFPKLYNFLKEKHIERGLPIEFLNQLKTINKDSLCLDLGANVGLISSMMARRGATVYAFEPNSIAYSLLEKKCKKFTNIKPIKKAAGIMDRKANLYLHNDNNGENNIKFSEASSLKSGKPNISKENTEVIEEIDFASFINQFNYIDIIKIDIEGYEVELLNHLLDNKSLNNVSMIFVETHYHKWKELEKPTLQLIERVKQSDLNVTINFDWI
tara:strand:- start:6 stop:734 length:729 start_codon:yes stop_codon:yes gene_type:complete